MNPIYKIARSDRIGFMTKNSIVRQVAPRHVHKVALEMVCFRFCFLSDSVPNTQGMLPPEGGLPRGGALPPG